MVRSLGCWLIGSMMVAPLSCGSADESGSNVSKPESSGSVAIAANSTGTNEQSASEDADPLVPPIDLGGMGYGAPARSHGGGSFDFLAVNEFDFTSDDRAAFHAHGEEVCASGCAASSHPTKELTKTHFARLLKQFSTEPMTENSESLEKLLFYGRQTQRWINRHGTAPLDSVRTAFLRNELKRTHVLISFRIVDEHGVVRTQLPPTRVPLDRRHVFKMDVKNLQPLVTSGTVKRVGLHHLWTRL